MELAKNPFYKSLRTHKIHNPRHSQAWSSYVTGVIRIIWDFSKKNSTVILALEVGGHNKVY